MRSARAFTNSYAKVFPILVGLTLASISFAQSARSIADKTLPSVGLVTLYDANSTPLSLGSCFVVGEGLVMTNLHVIEGGARATIAFGGKSSAQRVEAVVAVDVRRDLALLKVSTVGLQALTIADSSSVRTGDRIYAAGNPRGLTGTFSDGLISAVRTFEDGITLFQVTAPISPGSSGGPILNSSGSVIGVATATIEDGQNLNFAVPSNYVKSLLGQTGGRTKTVSFYASSKANTFSRNRRTKGAVADPDKFEWTTIGRFTAGFSFVIENKSIESIENVYCILIFYDEDKKPIHFVKHTYRRAAIPPGLARTIELKKGSDTLPGYADIPESVIKNTKWVAIRVLDYTVVK